MQNDQYLAANFWITLRIQFLFTLCGGGEKLNISKSLHEQEIYMCKSSPFYLGPSSAWHIAGAQDMGGTDQQVGKQKEGQKITLNFFSNWYPYFLGVLGDKDFKFSLCLKKKSEMHQQMLHINT